MVILSNEIIILIIISNELPPGREGLEPWSRKAAQLTQALLRMHASKLETETKGNAVVKQKEA